MTRAYQAHTAIVIRRSITYKVIAVNCAVISMTGDQRALTFIEYIVSEFIVIRLARNDLDFAIAGIKQIISNDRMTRTHGCTASTYLYCFGTRSSLRWSRPKMIMRYLMKVVDVLVSLQIDSDSWTSVGLPRQIAAVSYTHLTLPTTPYV